METLKISSKSNPNSVAGAIAGLIKEKELKHMKPDVLLIDLASKPGGIEGTKARQMGLKYIWALAIPRKGCTNIICRIYKRSYI